MFAFKLARVYEIGVRGVDEKCSLRFKHIGTEVSERRMHNRSTNAVTMHMMVTSEYPSIMVRKVKTAITSGAYSWVLCLV